ncbi:MAG: chorismate synthase [Spirochaetaceae bacterium]|jgi:chorismate synthase|nr:chorismate synthase [Spirochaetaceae bacterium]
MIRNTFGDLFTVTTFGESHGPAMGCVVDGCPAGLPLDIEIIRRDLQRRRPGGPAATTRIEADEPEILSGVFQGKTLGTPIAILIRNTSQRSTDYDSLRDLYRPGHADWTWETKYGVRDHRGGGRSSGRETVGRVAAGAIAKVLLASSGITIRAWVAAIAGIAAPGPEDPGFDLDEAERNLLRVPHQETADRILAEIERLRASGDSAGGIVCCSTTGLPPGLGEPVFGKLDARIASAMLSLGAVKGIEFGAGFKAAESFGSEQNDRPIPGYTNPAVDLRRPRAPILPEGIPDIRYHTNNAGGVLGGISTGMPLEFRVAFKPVPSIMQQQKTTDRRGIVRKLVIRGRHDICIVPRAVPVVEAMTALVLADLLLLQRASRV